MSADEVFILSVCGIFLVRGVYWAFFEGLNDEGLF